MLFRSVSARCHSFARSVTQALWVCWHASGCSLGDSVGAFACCVVEVVEYLKKFSCLLVGIDVKFCELSEQCVDETLGRCDVVAAVGCDDRESPEGFVNLTEHDWESTIFDHTGADSVGEKPGSGGEYAGGVVPGGESVGHFGAVIARGELVSPGPEVRRDRTEHRQEPLRCAR